jgi:hypothetical protein
MSKLQEIKAAAAALEPEDQFELFNWWIQTDVFKARQLAALKRDLELGLDQLADGHFRTYDDTNIMQLAEQVGRSGRERLKKEGTKSSSA